MKVDTQYLEKTFERNMASFSKYLPDIFEYFKDYQESRFFLAYDANGDYNIFDSVKQKNIYDCNPIKYCADTFKEYENNPILFSRLQAGSNEVGSIVNKVHVDATIKLANIAVLLQNISSGRVKLPSKIKSMLFVGVGAGHDFEYIVNNKNIDNLIILENNPDIFFASMHLIDWSIILENYSHHKKNISIIIDNDTSFLANEFFNKIVSYGHHLANSLFLYCPLLVDSSQLIDDVVNIVRGRLLAGFGFYDDARYSIGATYENIRRGVPIYLKNKKLFEITQGIEAPVFVIGNGPSLDKDIDFIKTNQNKAIIISCGSAIKPLERNNIIPDFHVECERTAWTKSWLDQVNEDFLKKINFIGLNVIFPDVFDLFKSSGMLAKTGETGSFLLARALEKLKGEPFLPLHAHVNPTVSHMGIGAMPFFGFRKFYLFGVDMGYEDPSYHHSRDSSYNDLSNELKEGLTPKESTSFEVPSNFGNKKILSNGDYASFRAFMEGMLELNKSFFGISYECYNCSDGSLIKGSIPLEGRSFSENWGDIDKKAITSRIMNDFFCSSTNSDLIPILDCILEEDILLVKNACMEMSTHFRKKFDSVDEADKLIDESINLLFRSKDLFSDDKAYLLTLFSGSLLYMFSTMTRVLYFRVQSEKIKVDAAKKCFEVISEFFETIMDDFSKNCLKNDDTGLYGDVFNVQ